MDWPEYFKFHPDNLPQGLHIHNVYLNHIVEMLHVSVIVLGTGSWLYRLSAQLS